MARADYHQWTWTIIILTGMVITTLAVRSLHPFKSEEEKLTESSLAFLKKALEDPDPFLRSAAAKAIADSGHPTAQLLLEDALKDHHPTVRIFAVEGLRDFPTVDAIRLLSHALKDTDASVRLTAVRIMADRHDRLKEAEVIHPLLKKSVRDQDLSVSMVSLGILRRSAYPGTLQTLREALNAEQAEVRLSAAFALGLTQDPEAVELLRRALSDSDATVRGYAVQAIGELNTPEGLPYLLEALSDPDPSVRSTAVTALSSANSPGILPLLRETAHDPDRLVRLSAGLALLKLGETQAGRFVQEALQDPDYGIRSAAARSLGELIRQGPTGIQAAEAILLLAPLLGDDVQRVRSAAVRALGMTGHSEAKPLLVHAFQDISPIVRCYAAGALLRILNPPQPLEVFYDKNP